MIARSPCLSSPSLPHTNPSRNTHPSPPSIPRKPPSSLPLRHHSIIKASGSAPSSTGKKQSDPMTISPSVRISDRKLTVRGFPILSSIPDTVVSTPAVSGVFLGADFPQPASRHVVSLGVLRNVRFMSCFRFKLWWMAQKMGDKGSDVPNETQFLLIESLAEEDGDADTMCSTMYTVFLPLVEGSFRACLNGTPGDDLELCLESGDAGTSAAAFSHAVFVGAAASDPFAAITSAVCAVKSHLSTFHHRTEKRLPGIVDYFGWCTWDAFYQDVSQEGVEAGLRSLSAGGMPPKFIIIDDGWQMVDSDEIAVEADKPLPLPLPRLIGIKENNKFQSKDDPAAGISKIVSAAKEKYGVKYVYVWHALTGYWGGVRPGVKVMEEFGSVMQYPKISPGVAENEPWMMNDPLTVHGLGLVNPKSVYKFYNELHGYLAAAGVDGVKVDVQCILETLGAGFGGRVELTKRFHQALDASIAKNFHGNNCIACMSHNTDALYCSKQTAMVRASDDFYPRDPVSHTIHIASVAYNSVFLGEFMLPDWDMFHSFHPAAEYHASARAISGGPVYVSDAPGKHNFNLLRKLVLPDGSILRARLPGRPTRDCLFTDPARDGVSLLKIWNMNKYTGVLGVYNCQGAAWSSIEKKNAFHHTGVDALTCAMKGSDVHLIEEAATDSNWNGNCAVYNHSDGTLIVLPHDVAMPVSLKVLEHEVYTVTPIKVLASGFRFAPLGLVDMFNAGGAIEGLSYHVQSGAESLEVEHGLAPPSGLLENRGSDAVGLVCMEVKGCGRLGAFSSTKPRKCLIGASDVEFSYDPSSGFLFLQIEKMPEGDHKVHRIVIEL